MAKSNIIIGGLVPFTTIDYPKKISAVLFLQGCPWKCIYCSNQHLLNFRKQTEQDKNNYEYVLELLKKRTKILDAVVFSGGEATAQTDEIITTIEEIKEFAPHFKFGLHTNGCFPEKLEKLLPYIDWVGLDIKSPCKKYEQITQTIKSSETAFKSLKLLSTSGKEFEVRTTADPTILSKDDILEIATILSTMKVRHYAIQRCRPNPGEPQNPLSMQYFTDKEFEKKLSSLIPNLEMRF